MSISQGKLTGALAAPAMNLKYGVQLQRITATYTAIGSMASDYTTLPTVLPCDVAPMSDDTVMQQFGQQEMLTHVLHFQAGTDVRPRDQAKIVYAPQPGNYGNVGDIYFIAAVLEPSEDIAYIRCRAYKSKAVTG